VAYFTGSNIFQKVQPFELEGLNLESRATTSKFRLRVFDQNFEPHGLNVGARRFKAGRLKLLTRGIQTLSCARFKHLDHAVQRLSSEIEHWNGVFQHLSCVCSTLDRVWKLLSFRDSYTPGSKMSHPQLKR